MALPQLRLELHAFSEQPRDRFVFINGRKYVEGERLIEGPQLVSIELRGAVLSGKASSIQAVTRRLRALGVARRSIHAKAYWAPGKTGLD